MNISSLVIDALTRDHAKLRYELNIIKDNSLSKRERKSSLNRLMPKLVSVFQNEEKVIHSYMKKQKEDEMRTMANESEEEHKNICLFLAELKIEKSSTNEWTEKLKQLVKLIENHFKNEENDIFLSLNNYLNKDSDVLLFNKYQMNNSTRSR